MFRSEMPLPNTNRESYSMADLRSNLHNIRGISETQKYSRSIVKCHDVKYDVCTQSTLYKMLTQACHNALVGYALQ